uniref:Uncharacterized protein n=1 Tax=viral metagenome TaxID=1070528 RepID=A0A6M3XTZ0_9ZZZZ
MTTNKEVFIGIDNGVTGSIGIITPEQILYIPTPTITVQDYTKRKKTINRINFNITKFILARACDRKTMVLLERPMINPDRFNQSIIAARAYEATLIIVEELGISHDWIDSRKWQKLFFPEEIIGTGTKMLKLYSNSVGKRLFPDVDIGNLDDYDGLLIAEYCRRLYG